MRSCKMRGGDLTSKEKIKPLSVNKAHNANQCDSNKATCDSNADNTADSNANFGILHLATKYIPSHTPEDISSLIDSNIAFGSEILEATMDLKPRFFVNILTFSQFANSHAYNPASFYDATKQAFYEIIELYKNTFKETKFLHILLYNTYGSNDTRDKILNLWDKISQNGEDLAMSAGEQCIDISHIDDVVRGLDMAIKSAESLDSNKIYTLENFPRYTLKDIAKIFETATKRELKIAWGAKPYRKNEIFSPISSVDSPKFVKLPHYEAKISLESGIKKVFLHKNRF